MTAAQTIEVELSILCHQISVEHDATAWRVTPTPTKIRRPKSDTLTTEVQRHVEPKLHRAALVVESDETRTKRDREYQNGSTPEDARATHS